MKLHSRKEWDNISPQDKGRHNCPFCKDYNNESEYIIADFTYWYIIHNKYPVLGLETHLMAIPKRHIKLAHDITPEEMGEYPKIEKFIYNFFGEKAYFTFMRESLQNRSLEHIHYHFLPGQISYYDIEHFLQKQGF